MLCPKAGCGKYFGRADLATASSAEQMYERDRQERKRLADM